MIIQATPYGTKKEEPFAFTYSGDFTDSRVDGIGDVTLNTSGKLTVLSGKATVSVYILGAGGGGACAYISSYISSAGGGSGGYQTIEVTLEPGTYEIVIGTGGVGAYASQNATAGNGGDTSAFGYTSTGGVGGYAHNSWTAGAKATPGTGGTPNGGTGATNLNSAGASGGSPNGGNGTNNAANNNGGNGLVRITFS